MMLALMFVSGIMMAQDMQAINSIYGIDHGKKLVVSTGRLPEGTKPYKESLEVRGEDVSNPEPMASDLVGVGRSYTL